MPFHKYLMTRKFVTAAISYGLRVTQHGRAGVAA